MILLLSFCCSVIQHNCELWIGRREFPLKSMLEMKLVLGSKTRFWRRFSRTLNSRSFSSLSSVFPDFSTTFSSILPDIFNFPIEVDSFLRSLSIIHLFFYVFYAFYVILWESEKFKLIWINWVFCFSRSASFNKVAQ